MGISYAGMLSDISSWYQINCHS